MNTTFTLSVPKAKTRNPLAVFQERKQVMRDRRQRRAKDARKSWKNEEY